VTEQRPPAVGVIGLALVAGGTVAVLIALLGPNWYRGDTTITRFGGASADATTFRDLHNSLTEASTVVARSGAAQYVHFGIAPSYFSSLAWILLICAVVLALLAVLPLGGATRVFRALGAVVAAAGIAATLWAINLVSVDDELASRLGGAAPTYGDYLEHTGAGAWLAVVGFASLLGASLVGPRRAQLPAPQS
jgi:hypothetical protein